MNLLEIFTDNDTILDCSVSIIQEARKRGFNGFSGYCAQAAILINECLFDNKQQIFASFNKSLEEHGHHIGHVACLIELSSDEYFILDADAIVKATEDISSWGMLDPEDLEYQKMFETYGISKTFENFENISEMVITRSFVREHFDCSHLKEQQKILSDCALSIIPLFTSKKLSKTKLKF